MPARHGANRIDARQVRLGRFLQDVRGDAGVVVDRIGVRHAGEGREAARHGGRDARGNRFLVFLPGLAQVHVHVDEPRAHHEAIGNLHHRRRRVHGKIAADPHDPISIDEHVEDAVAPVHRADHAPALQQFHSVPREIPTFENPTAGFIPQLRSLA